METSIAEKTVELTWADLYLNVIEPLCESKLNEYTKRRSVEEFFYNEPDFFDLTIKSYFNNLTSIINNSQAIHTRSLSVSD